MSDTTPLLDVSGLTKHFPIKGGFPIRRTVGAVQAVDGLDFQVAEGESLGLVGESGCGKSTTGRLITRLLEPTAGRISYRGQDITHANRKQLAPIRSEIQMIFQDPYASLNPRHTVGKIISGPMEINGINPPGGHEKRVRELLEIVGLNPEHYNRFPHEFSGGQRQRIGVARPRHPYTRALLSAVPEATVDEEPRERIRLTGDVPSPINPPSGCRFRTRCWKATEKCATEAPPLVQVEGNKPGHLTACHYPETEPTIPAPRLSKDPEAAA
ncbi:oligopeptide/dipeptide ABC transporter ATP-binding protein [Streptomyces sp. NRRL S-1896]|uniref:oligopeptide/dipeptide ABC transporter ATP-binding protein n=1 Tax=Streptomyces sp. NRRL S-1896 TaxID=1463893 RepID=UPI0004CCB7ED|nr:oligopeptide/dipeptide ABC transporter ATP-binding protein [Streptomyces sp. NRRL S-1896]